MAVDTEKLLEKLNEENPILIFTESGSVTDVYVPSTLTSGDVAVSAQPYAVVDTELINDSATIISIAEDECGYISLAQCQLFDTDEQDILDDSDE